MKKALKTVFAAVLTGAMAMSAFAVNASAAWYDRDYVIGPDGQTLISVPYGSYATVTANQYKGGTITVSAPYGSGVTITGYEWSGTNVNTGSGSSTTIKDAGSYSATCKITYSYKVSSTGVYNDSIILNISGDAFSTKEDAQRAGQETQIVYGDGSYWGNGSYWYDYNYDYAYGDYVYVNGKWYDKDECDYYYGSWHPRSYATVYDYNPNYYNGYYNGYYYGSYKNGLDVDWDTDTFYYNGKKQIPTATVTIGSRTVELDVRVISGDKDSTDVGSYRVSASLPSGYRGVKLSGSTLRYTIEEPLKQGLVSESGSTYYYQNGKYQTGWETVSGSTYYFEKDGKAATGWKWMDGAWYYFGNDGAMRTGWVATNGKTYYVNESGKMVSNKWQKLDGYWYFFDQDGAMAESKWVKTGSYWYYCAGDGRMATNTTIPGGYYVNANGVWVK